MESRESWATGPETQKKKKKRERGIAVCAFIEIVRIHDNLKQVTSEAKISGGHKASMNHNLLQTWEL